MSGESPTVYWTRSGRTYHETRYCSALSRAKQVYSGPFYRAHARGLRPCRLCATANRAELAKALEARHSAPPQPPPAPPQPPAAPVAQAQEAAPKKGVWAWANKHPWSALGLTLAAAVLALELCGEPAEPAETGTFQPPVATASTKVELVDYLVSTKLIVTKNDGVGDEWAYLASVCGTDVTNSAQMSLYTNIPLELYMYAVEFDEWSDSGEMATKIELTGAECEEFPVGVVIEETKGRTAGSTAVATVWFTFTRQQG